MTSAKGSSRTESAGLRAATQAGILDPSQDAGTRTLTHKAYEAIADLIRNKKLKGGDPIIEARLADTLHLSRTPLREALLILEGEGLVVRGPGRSIVVRNVDLKEYLQSLKVRELIEPEAAALACGRITVAEIAAVHAEIAALAAQTPYDIEAHWRSDRNLHELFIFRCGNDVLIRELRALRTTTHLFEIARLSNRLGPDSAEHIAILQALEQGDAKLARKSVHAHIKSLYRFALKTLE